MRTLPELFALYQLRLAEHSTDGAVWTDLALVYDGGQRVNISELDRTAASSSPNLVAQGIDQYARFTASARPEVESFPLRPGIARSRDLAASRVRALKGWYDNSRMDLADLQWARFYYGYGAAPVMIRPDPVEHAVPRWEVRNPMGVLPGPKDLPYLPDVPDLFVVSRQSVRWVNDHYGVNFGSKCPPDALLEVVEYNDAEQSTIFCTGFSGPDTPVRDLGTVNAFGSGVYGGYWSERGTHIERLGSADSGRWLVMLSTAPNPAEMCLGSYPGAISLSKVTGLVNSILARHTLHSRMTELMVLAVTDGISPDEWLVEDPNGQGMEIVAEPDGLRRKRGQIRGGTIVIPTKNPTYLAPQVMDRLEAWSRSDSGVTSSLGGESGTNIRTKARGDALDSMVIDPRVEEAHLILQAAKELQNRQAVAWAKAVGRSRPISVYVPGRKSAGVHTYVATEVFETGQTAVRYPVPGTNTSGLLIGAAQSLGTRMMSLDEARRLNPWVEDPAAAATGVWLDEAREVIMANLSTVMQASPEDGAWAVQRIAAGDMPEDVQAGVQRRIQQRQATAGPPGTPEGPGIPGTPEAQPGLGLPGVADEPTPIPESPPGPANLARLITQSRIPSMPIAAERAG